MYVRYTYEMYTHRTAPPVPDVVGGGAVQVYITQTHKINTHETLRKYAPYRTVPYRAGEVRGGAEGQGRSGWERPTQTHKYNRYEICTK